MNKLPKREEVKERDKWNISLIYKTDELFEEELEVVKKEVDEFSKYESMEITISSIKNFIDNMKRVSRKIGKLAIYAHMNRDSDTTNSKYSGYNSQVESLGAKFGEITSFFTPKLLSLDDTFLQELKNAPELEFYKQYLDNIIRYKPYTLSYKEEKLFAMASEALGAPIDIFSNLNSADMKFKPIMKDGKELSLSHGSFGLYIVDDDRDVRKQAMFNIHNEFIKYQNTLASILSGHIKGEIFDARGHNFNSVMEASLFNDAVTPEVLNSLIESVNNNLPLLHEYLDFKKEMMNLDDLHLYDLYKPLAKDFNKKYSYDEAIEIVLKALEPLGEQYITDLKAGLSRGWIDKFENEGKRSGAYSTGVYDTEPYILLNFNGTLNSVFTMAHEIGHSMHSFYSRKNQDSLYSGYKIFVAEVASIFNETLLKEYLLKNATSDNERFGLLNKYLENFRTTMFRQVMFAEFEKDIHEKAESGVPLTVDNLNSWYYDLNKKYFGENIIIDDEIRIEWARIPHFYYNFYVYKYAIGFAVSAALAKKVLEGDDNDLKDYLGFLSAGSSDYPVEILKKAGVDLTTPKPIDDALSLFAKTIKDAKEISKKI